MAFCTKCGNQLRDGLAFCTKCGAAVRKAPVSAAAAAVPPPIPVAEEEPATKAEATDETARVDSSAAAVEPGRPEAPIDAAHESEPVNPTTAPDSVFETEPACSGASETEVLDKDQLDVDEEQECQPEPEPEAVADAPQDQPASSQPASDQDKFAEELGQVVAAAESGAAWVADRVKTSIDGAKASFEAAENGEDTAEDQLADKLSGGILAVIKWFKKVKANFNAEDVKGWLKKNKKVVVFAAASLVVLALALGATLIFSSSSSSTKSPTSNSATSTTSNKTTAPKKTETKNSYSTQIKVKCEKNLVLSTYDVEIFVDDTSIATLDHGDEGSWDRSITQGSHTLKICKKGDTSVDGTKVFTISAESVIECTVSTTSTQVQIKDFSCLTKEAAKKAEEEAEKKMQEEEQAKLESQQFVSDGTGATHSVHFSVSSSKNVLFSKYNINFYLDGSLIKTVEQGETTEWDQELEGGKHTVRFASADDDSVDGMQAFTVSAESYLSCTLSCSSDKVAIGNFSFETQLERDQAAEEAKRREAAEAEAAKQKEAAEAEAKAKQEAEAAEKAKVLTVDNCEDLANLLTSSSSDASSFAAAYSGRTIEFDGNIADMSSHNGAKTRFDVLIYAGDYSEESARGPHMQYKDVNYYNMGASGIDSVQMGLNVRIRAKVGSYNASADILSLTPVSMTAR